MTALAPDLFADDVAATAPVAPVVAPPVDAAPAAPVVEVPTVTHTAEETAAEKRARLMSAGAAYRDSAPHQVAALTWAMVELREETERGNDIAAAAVAEQRTANLIAFYTADPRTFPEGVRGQIAAHLGITVS